MKYLVAKSYQNLPKIGEIFISNNKKYIKVQTKTGNIKTVRVYTDSEYFRMYPEERKVNKPAGTQKEVFGFDKGYITIFKGDTYANLEWFQEKKECRYTRFWGWYVISTEEVPADIPFGVVPIKLPWELAGKPDGSLKDEDSLRTAIDSLIYEESSSEFVGSIGERLEIQVKVTGNFPIEGSFGTTILHTMEDYNGNVFVWATAAKNWPVGTEKLIRGTVKEHKTYRNTKQTVLTRCTER